MSTKYVPSWKNISNDIKIFIKNKIKIKLDDIFFFTKSLDNLNNRKIIPYKNNKEVIVPNLYPKKYLITPPK
jgi:hypothetical protein